MVLDMLHVICAGCVARYVHMIAPWPFECTLLETYFGAVKRL